MASAPPAMRVLWLAVVRELETSIFGAAVQILPHSRRWSGSDSSCAAEGQTGFHHLVDDSALDEQRQAPSAFVELTKELLINAQPLAALLVSNVVAGRPLDAKIERHIHPVRHAPHARKLPRHAFERTESRDIASEPRSKAAIAFRLPTGPTPFRACRRLGQALSRARALPLAA
jgi:hypothetical protein